MKNLRIVSLGYFILFLIGCAQDKSIIKVEQSDKKPGLLTNVSVENQPGGAKITYNLPTDENLLYVEAKYSSKEGEERVAKASLYTNFIQIEGFSSTNEYTVSLSAVTQSEVHSDPVTVKITPLTPPIKTVFQSITVQPDFGGIRISFTNDLENEYVFNTLIKLPDGKFTNFDRLYSKAKSRSYNVRNLPAVETQFYIYITDKWRNVSDSLKVVLTPIFEVQLNKSLWTAGNLLNDSQIPHYATRPVSNLWDNRIGSTLGYFIAIVPAQNLLPNWITINLGQPATLSRMRINQYTLSNYAFNLGNPQVFEIWGSNNPLPNGSWDSWTLLLEGESVKPSGSPAGIKTTEDEQYAVAGEDYTFPSGLPPYKYIRFKTIKTWGRVDNLLLDELTLWGQN